MLLVLALICLTLMTGNEICVAVFINPVLRSMPENEQVPFLRRAASHLGMLMPFWYSTSLVLTVAAAFWMRKGNMGWLNPAVWSALLQVAVICMTVTLLVPINNRLGKLQDDETGWTAAATRWDRLHQLRIVLLLGAVLLLVRAFVMVLTMVV